MTIYFDDGVTVIRSMLPGDAKILYDTYAPCVNDDDLLLFMSKDLKKS